MRQPVKCVICLSKLTDFEVVYSGVVCGRHRDQKPSIIRFMDLQINDIFTFQGAVELYMVREVTESVIRFTSFNPHKKYEKSRKSEFYVKRLYGKLL